MLATPQTEEFLIQVGSLQPPIRVRVRRNEQNRLILEQSHFLKTAIQYLPYAVREVDGDSPRAAFEELKKNILGFYEQALRRGYTPEPNWLVPNGAFLRPQQ